MNGRTQENRALMAAGQLLEDAKTTGTQSISGTYCGTRVTFLLSARPGWSVEVETTPIPLAIDISNFEYSSDRTAHEPFGEDAFDARYFVDAEPVVVAQAVVGMELQQRIVCLNPDRVTLKPGLVRLIKRFRWYYAEADQIQEAIEIAVALARSAWAGCTASEASEATSSEKRSRNGHPFRGTLKADPFELEEESQEQRIGAAITRQEKRWRIGRAKAIAAYFVVVLSMVLYIVLCVLLKHYR